MHKLNGQIQYSPSDITQFVESPFASWMQRYSLENPDMSPEIDAKDELMHALASMGAELEQTIEKKLIKQGNTVIRIERGPIESMNKATVEAMRNGADVIVQGALSLHNVSGYADFLIKVSHSTNQKDSIFGNWHYEVWETKLSNTVKPAYAIQLCCYTEMLESVQGYRPKNMTIVSGNQEKHNLRTSEYFSYYKAQLSEFISVQSQFNSNDMPDPANSASWGNWSNFAQSLLIAKDHLFQVATITRGQIKKLNLAGITTMQQLANFQQNYVPGLNPEILKKLIAQADIQKRSDGKQVPLYKIIHHEPQEQIGLSLLPPHSPLDVFFDIEGYPLDEGGLEYLWGNTYFDDEGQRQFIDFWAHNQEQEKQAFQEFINWVYQRWLKDPSMHIYHYANYEIAACRKLMGRFGVCEQEVDQLLRNEVFVDLYKIVKGGLLLGEPRYSIKNVEHLYRENRNTAVENGSDSIVVYDQWRKLHQLGQQGDTWQSSSILNDIRDYNIDDCNSTQELVAWLRVQQAKHKIEYLGKTTVIEAPSSEAVDALTSLRDRLLHQASVENKTDLPKAKLTENMAWMLEFHRREAKPVFWRLFERRGLDHQQLEDDLDCLSMCERTEREAFKATSRDRNFCYEYSFNPSQEFKGASRQFYVLGQETEEGKAVKVTFASEYSDLKNGLIVLKSKKELDPIISLLPDEYVRPHPIPEAINQIAIEYESGNLADSKSAIVDFLTRSRPRIMGHKTGPIITQDNPKERMKEIIYAISNLDSSYLAIQGPPGAGKTFTGKHVIAELMKLGKKVGITSNGHKAINNLLISTARLCAEEGIKATFTCTKNTELAIDTLDVDVLKNSELSDAVQLSCVIGTTAWGFSRDDMANQLDYLFVDEAGQVAVANLVAMSRSAKNIVLMGDQMQLAQPSQGTHPSESGLSVLDYLLHDTATISPTMGVFLNVTYRMHSLINSFISEHIYDGKLVSLKDNDKRIIEVPADHLGPINTEAGLVFVPVEHAGNTQASHEEALAIKTIANDLIGRTFHTGNNEQPTRTITWDDILFVAPYNHQVAKLNMELGAKAKVGSVDKFQGQEAPIVILSMCSSDANESPRGIDFLFDKQRINVAISRAQSLAIIVANPMLAKAAVGRIEQLKQVNLFSALIKS